MISWRNLFRPAPSSTPAAPPADETRSHHVEAAQLAAPSMWLSNLFDDEGIRTLAGIKVSPETACQSPAVRACVETIARSVATLPLVLYEEDASGSRKPAKSHPAYALFASNANPWTPASRMIEQVTRDAGLYGNGFNWINRRDARPQELIHMRPPFVTVKYDLATSEPFYLFADGGDAKDINFGDVIHIMSPSIDGIMGVAPVAQAQEIIALNIAMTRYGSRLFGQGGRPSGILKFPNKLGEAAIKRMKPAWQQATAGHNSGGTAIIEEGGTFQPLAFSSVDSQYLELFQFTINEICRVYGVPPSLVYELGRSTWGNASEMASSFLKFTLARWLKTWEDELNLKLLTPDERGRFYFKFNTDDLLRTDLTTRAAAYASLITSRVLCPNEVRELENRPPYEGGDVFVNPNTTLDGGAGIDPDLPAGTADADNADNDPDKDGDDDAK